MRDFKSTCMCVAFDIKAYTVMVNAVRSPEHKFAAEPGYADWERSNAEAIQASLAQMSDLSPQELEVLDFIKTLTHERALNAVGTVFPRSSEVETFRKLAERGFFKRLEDPERFSGTEMLTTYLAK